MLTYDVQVSLRYKGNLYHTSRYSAHLHKKLKSQYSMISTTEQQAAKTRDMLKN